MSEPEITVIARNPQEMQLAQAKMVEWAGQRIAKVEGEKKELEANLEIARKNKWRTSTIQTNVRKAHNAVEFYTKIKAALEAGYVIIPNFDIDVFAIRTTKEEPREAFKELKTQNSWSNPQLPNHVPDCAPVGEGNYVNNEPQETFSESELKVGDKTTFLKRVDSGDFLEVDFPFKLAKPQILDATARAMAQKIFDDFGVSPQRNVRKGDPMVIGRIVNKTKRGWQGQQTVSFLVAWFINTEDL